MAIFQVLYWRDIPAQARVFEGKRPLSMQLPERFQTEIDRVAMSEGLTGTDAYLDQWNWSEKTERVGEGQELLEQIVSELVEEYDQR